MWLVECWTEGKKKLSLVLRLELSPWAEIDGGHAEDFVSF